MLRPKLMLPCLAVLLLAACGGGSDKGATGASPRSSATSASPSPSATPQSRNGQLAAVMRQIATAEEYFFTDEARYLAFVGTFPPQLSVQGPTTVPDAAFGVALLPHDAYCVVAVDRKMHGFKVYLSTEGMVSSKRDPSTLPTPCKRLVLQLKP